MCQATGEIRVITPESLPITDTGSNPGLKAEFSASPSSGRAPLMVAFFDLSTGNPVAWNWVFGDGYSSEQENPVHTYSQGGMYTVELTVHDRDGGSDTGVKESYITANPVPLQANFTAEPMSGPAPLTVQFRDRSTGARVWLWNFGDGSKESMLPDPSHSYIEPGLYQVTLKVSNELGDTETHQQDISVSPSGEVIAEFSGSPRSGPAPLTVQFADQSTGNVVSWLWDFGDHTTDSTRNPKHTYLERGVYPVTLTVSSPDKRSDTKKKNEYISVSVSPESGSIILSPGWNFISVPRMLVAGKDTAEIFQHVDSGGHSAFRFAPVNGGWIPLIRSDPVQPFEAYWVYSTKDDVIPLSITPSFGQISSRTLTKGWNTAGFTVINQTEARQVLSSVKETWQNCIGFNSITQKYDEMIFKGVNDNISVYPYRGYWVYMSEEGVLTGNII